MEMEAAAAGAGMKEARAWVPDHFPSNLSLLTDFGRISPWYRMLELLNASFTYCGEEAHYAPMGSTMD